MREYPTMAYRQYIRRWAAETKDGKFFCQMCGEWINHQRWVHFKKLHQYEKLMEKLEQPL
jgi:hypothetical protein